MFDLYKVLLIIILGLLTAGFIYFLLRKFEYSIFLLCLSPWISAIFYDNSPAFDAHAADASLGSYLRIGLVFILSIAGIIKYIQLLPLNNGKISVNFVLLSIFIFVAILSTGYSIDKDFTLIRSVSFLALEGFMLGFDSWLSSRKNHENYDKTLNVFFKFVVFCALINLSALPVLHDRVWWWEAENRFLGLWDQPNTMGSFCVISYPIVLWKFSNSKSFYARLFLILISIILVFMHFITGSRTSLIVACTGLVIWFFVLRKFLLAASLFCAFILIAFLLIQLKPERFQREDSNSFTDLTGREEFWKGAQTLIFEKPLSGYGYSVEGKVWEDARFYNVKNSLWKGSSRASLHNGYISTAIGVGLIAFALWSIILLFPLWRSMFLPANTYKAFFLSMIIMLLLTNFAESAITGGNSIDSVFFWIVWVMASKKELILRFKIKQNYVNYFMNISNV
ncbi:MAG: O-antigen ligase family protein [Clostridiales bacterium]